MLNNLYEDIGSILKAKPGSAVLDIMKRTRLVMVRLSLIIQSINEIK